MSDTVKQALAPLVDALRGALQWHAETGDAGLVVPSDFRPPPLGQIAPAEPVAQPPPVQAQVAHRPAPQQAQPAPASAPQAASAPTSAPTEAPAPATPLRPSAGGALVPTVVWGNPWASTVFVLEAGSADAPPAQNAQFPLGGEAGALLMKMIQAMKFGWADVFLVCCVRQGEALRASEMRPAVDRMLSLAPRRVLVPMGVTATRALIDTDAPMPRLRGKKFERSGVVVRPTFPPDALVQNPKLKADAWSDLQGVMRELKS